MLSKMIEILIERANCYKNTENLRAELKFPYSNRSECHGRKQ